MINFICDKFTQSKNVIALPHVLNIFNNVKQDIKITNLNDISKDIKYYFVIAVQGYPSHELINSNVLPDNVIEKIHNGYDIDIILITFHESDENNSLDIIEKFFNEKNINTSRVHFYSGNSIIQDYKNKINSNINVFPNKHIPYTMSRQLYLSGKQSEYKEDRMNMFQCYNRNLKQHRIAILCALHYHNLLSEIDWSNLYGSRLSEYVNNGDWNYFKNEDSFMLESNSKKYNSSLQFLLDSGNYKSSEEDFEFDQNGPQHNLSYENNIYKNAYINIVTETQFNWSNVIHITEKTLQPFYFFQIPIIIGTVNHCAKVKELYDLDFFEDFIDLSYDSEENDEKRFNMIVEEIKRISLIDKEDIKQMFNKDEFKKRMFQNRHKIQLLQFNDSESLFINKL